jgi:hypothetical protein
MIPKSSTPDPSQPVSGMLTGNMMGYSPQPHLCKVISGGADALPRLRGWTHGMSGK